MGKRKRHQDDVDSIEVVAAQPSKKQVVETSNPDGNVLGSTISLQIITGSYDRVLHGIIATIPVHGDSPGIKTRFKDNFLFNAHASAIKCLALSPLDGAETEKVILATGGTDERINLYSLSTSLPRGPSLPSLRSVPSLENSDNRELGTLLHHNSTVNVLYFPTKSKLISGSDDNTIAISRTKDWTVLSTIKAPTPKVQGRPSGDTAPLGGTPAGITDFAVHPSMKLMISVGKGEKCMRLWNLVTGKKANVLSFEKDLLRTVGESKWSRGEGQKVTWNDAGDEFAIAFERGVAMFGMDSEVKCVAIPQPTSKVHRVCYVSLQNESYDLLAISTEDGRILFYSTKDTLPAAEDEKSGQSTPLATAVSCLGGRETGVMGRIKDFQIIQPLGTKSDIRLLVTACSDGSVMIWQINDKELAIDSVRDPIRTNGVAVKDSKSHTATKTSNGTASIKRIGVLLGRYDTGNRVTCMQAFQLRDSDISDDAAEQGELDVSQVDSDNDATTGEEEEEEEEFSGFE